MNVPTWLWIASITLLVGLLAVDVFIIGRRPHEPTLRECAIAISFFIGLALIFGLGVWYFPGGRYAGEFYAGWLTEYSLSLDNPLRLRPGLLHLRRVLIYLGASHLRTYDEMGEHWVVMSDPEGNEFCVS